MLVGYVLDPQGEWVPSIFLKMPDEGTLATLFDFAQKLRVKLEAEGLIVEFMGW